MYIPEHFRNNNSAQVIEFLRARGFATFCAIQGDAPIASQFPFIVKDDSGKFLIEFHIPKKNPLADLAIAGMKFLVICNGPDHYIAADWYAKKEIPTWNFITNHLYGKPVAMNEIELLSHLTELCQVNEKKYADKDWQFDDNRTLVAPLFKHITGFRMVIDEIQPQWKLSQNQSENECGKLIEKLNRHGNYAKEIAAYIHANLTRHI